jgi:hypothetical protein
MISVLFLFSDCDQSSPLESMQFNTQKLSSRNGSHRGLDSIPNFLDGSVQDSSEWTTVVDTGVVSLHHDFISTTHVKGNTRLRDKISSYPPAVPLSPFEMKGSCKAVPSIKCTNKFGKSADETLSSLPAHQRCAWGRFSPSVNIGRQICPRPTFLSVQSTLVRH